MKDFIQLLREHYFEYNYLSNDLVFLMEVEKKLVKLSKCDDLTPNERKLVDLLPQVRETLT